MSFGNRFAVCVFRAAVLLSSAFCACGQTVPSESIARVVTESESDIPAAADENESVAARAGSVDFFLGVDFNYRDIMWNKVFEVLVNLTPGVRWNIGRGWSAAAEAWIPVLNDYGRRYGRVRLNVASVAKEMRFGRRWFLKASGGVFSRSRYGVDVKAMFVARDWLAFEAEAGLTGLAYIAKGAEFSTPGRFTGHAGVDFYIPRYDTQFRIRGGRFLYEDYGATVDAMRHFRHVTVGVFGRYSNLGGKSAGFQVVVMLPPYRRSARKVNFRPKSNFRLDYVTAPDSYVNLRYATDPEENDRQGWFDPSLLRWGVNATHDDFVYKRKAAGDAGREGGEK